MRDVQEPRICLLCKREIPADEEACTRCAAPEPVGASHPRADVHYDYDVATFGSLGLGIVLIIVGVLVFIGMWIAGYIWPYALILSLIGGAMIPGALKARAQRNEVRRRLAERRGTSSHRRRRPRRWR